MHRLLQTTPATTLAQIPRTLHPEALETPEELQAFDKTEIEKVRGIDRTGQMRICLEDARGAIAFQSFSTGPPRCRQNYRGQ